MTRALVTLLLVAAACGTTPKRTAKDAPMRSPSYDYPALPSVTTADGDTLGADRQSVSDKLNSGVRVGNEGVKIPPNDAGIPGAPEVEKK